MTELQESYSPIKNLPFTSHEGQNTTAFHAISPYQGKLSPERARQLVCALSQPGDVVLDPFCGSGTVLLESWALGRRAKGFDLNPYAVAVSRAKISPPKSLPQALKRINRLVPVAEEHRRAVDLRSVPAWVRRFYHPETLREAIGWSNALQENNEPFLFGCFLNLLHHQRSGFLSFPAAHVTPHLRSTLFPIEEHPSLYEYRSVLPRLLKKIERTLKTPLELNAKLPRSVQLGNASTQAFKKNSIDCIITSPPYMSELDYGRDNRLRLWFCGVEDWKGIDAQVSPGRAAFLNLMQKCIVRWESALTPGGYLALVLGDSKRSGKARVDIPTLIQNLVVDTSSKLALIDISKNEIPSNSRAVRYRAGTLAESTLIFRRIQK